MDASACLDAGQSNDVRTLEIAMMTRHERLDP
jgi:hypothetical protein